MEINVVKMITDRMPTFSKNQKKIANAILDGYNDSAYVTAAKLGALVGVSESTVVRFAYELGYDSYPAFQRAVQKQICVKMTPNQRIEASQARFSGSDVLKSVMTSDIEKIKYTMENMDRNIFSEAVDAIISARRIYILGVRSSASLVSFFNFNLSLIFDNVKLVQPTSSSEVFEQMLDIDKYDVLFAVSFPRYSTKIVNAVNYASAQGAKVISLTDSPLSPIAQNANYVLTAQSDMASFADSLTAPLSIINAILVAVSAKMQDEVKKRFDKLEAIWDSYDVYTKQ